MAVDPTTVAVNYAFANKAATLLPATPITHYSFNNVTTGVPTPHVWYITPTTAQIGGTVSVVGTGFGSSQGALAGLLYLGGLTPTPSSWVNVVASGSAYAAGRTINPVSDVADPEHQRIQFVVPQNAPAANVVVTTNA